MQSVFNVEKQGGLRLGDSARSALLSAFYALCQALLSARYHLDCGFDGALGPRLRTDLLR
jgi:hypothetical protein